MSGGTNAAFHKIKEEMSIQKRPTTTSSSSPSPSSVASSSASSMASNMFNECILPEKVINLVPESQILTELQQFEYRIDRLVEEKRRRMRQLLTSPRSEKHVLRIFVFHERQRIEGTNKYAFTLRIQGHLFDPRTNKLITDANTSNPAWKSGREIPKFTSLVKKCVIELDKKLYPNFEAIEWENHADFIDCTGFCIKRTIEVDPRKISAQTIGSGSDPLAPNVTIAIQLKHDPPVYHPSHALSKVLSSTPIELWSQKDRMPAQTLNQILTGVWNHVKYHGLQDPNDSSMINNNDVMREAFGTDRMSFSDVLTKVKEHLVLPDPIKIEYPLILHEDADKQQFEKQLDVGIEIAESTDILSDKKYRRELDMLNYEMGKKASRIRALKNKRDFMLAFSKAPIPFIHDLINSQTKDLLTMARRQQLEDRRRASYYHSPQVKEAVLRYFQKQNSKN